MKPVCCHFHYHEVALNIHQGALGSSVYKTHNIIDRWLYIYFFLYTIDLYSFMSGNVPYKDLPLQYQQPGSNLSGHPEG